MASSVAVSNYYGYFPAVTLEGVCLFSPSWQDFKQRWQWSMPIC
jgi:hypothetical protein